MGARASLRKTVPPRLAPAPRAALLTALGLCALALLLPACNSFRDEGAPSASSSRGVQRRTNTKENETDARARALQEQLRPWLSRRDEAPRRLNEQRCPDDAIRAQASTDDARTLSFRAEDARFEKKNLIPLRVTRAFTSVDAPALESQLMRGEALESAKSRIDWLAARRYVGVFHITDYAEPRWIWRLDRAKAEWVPGWIVAWLVVHDAKSGEALCSTQIHVKNDVTSAPLGTRTRSETAERLTAELGTAMADRATTALGKISAVLRAPSAEPETSTPVALAP